MTTPDLIGIAGYATTGKDTLAELLAKHAGYRVAHFADKLRQAVRLLNPMIDVLGRGEPFRYADAVDRWGYQETKFHHIYGTEVRRLLQVMGAEVGREMFGQDVWTDATLRSIKPSEKVVIADVRFPDEVAAVEAAGGVVIRLHRPGIGPLNGHASETALDAVPFAGGSMIELCNDGTPQQMLDLAWRALGCVEKYRRTGASA